MMPPPKILKPELNETNLGKVSQEMNNESKGQTSASSMQLCAKITCHCLLIKHKLFIVLWIYILLIKCWGDTWGKMSSNIIWTLEISLLFTSLCSRGLFPTWSCETYSMCSNYMGFLCLHFGFCKEEVGAWWKLIQLIVYNSIINK